MFDILTILPARKKTSPSGWVSFNAVCCTHNGETKDKRSRGGVKVDGHNWSYHCFNCGYKASFKLGRTLGFRARKLLDWLGVDSGTIGAINLESLKHKDIAQLLEDKNKPKQDKIKFNSKTLPDELELLKSTDNKFKDYLQSRSIDSDSYPFMISPNEKGRKNNRIVVPYTYDGLVVGWSARFLDNRTPKYINEQQPGYVFGVDLQQDHWTQCIVVEGLFDALSINALAVLHNTISEKQVKVIKQLQRDIVVVPDQDKSGLELINRAIKLGWSVSIPNWAEDIKDVNDAVKRYGRLGTLITIIQAKETSKIKIELAKRKLTKRIKWQQNIH